MLKYTPKLEEPHMDENITKWFNESEYKYGRIVLNICHKFVHYVI